MQNMSTLGLIFVCLMTAFAAMTFLCLKALKESSRPDKVKRYPGD